MKKINIYKYTHRYVFHEVERYKKMKPNLEPELLRSRKTVYQRPLKTTKSITSLALTNQIAMVVLKAQKPLHDTQKSSRFLFLVLSNKLLLEKQILSNVYIFQNSQTGFMPLNVQKEIT